MTQSILITGATSGIGAALAAHYAKSHRVFITGSKAVEAEKSSSLVHYIAADQTDPEASAKIIVQELKRNEINSLNVAILNAGLGFWRTPSEEKPQEIRATLDVNLAATIAQAHALFPLLAAANGTLVLIGSSAHRGQKNLATYAASKAALDGFARALRSEWQGRVSVQIIHPGSTRTTMHAKAGLEVAKVQRFFASAETAAHMIVATIKSKRLRTNLTITKRLMFAVTGMLRP